MSKRRADIELNQDNWDEDIPKVESGTFQKADKDSLAGRKILSVSGSRSAKTGTSGLFKSFTGLSNTASVPNVTFNFGNKFNSNPVCASSDARDAKDGKDDTEAEYLKQILTLNQNLYDWIGKHIKEDPYCILSPMFTDYEKHLRAIHEKFPDLTPQTLQKTQDKPIQDGVFKLSSNVDSANHEKVVTNSSSSTASTVATGPPSEFKSLTSSNLPGLATKPFAFNLPPVTGSTVPPLFKFGSSLPSTSPFATSSTLSSTDPSNTVANDDNEEYHPPKPEVKEIKEEGSVFTIRCKLFYKLQTEWRERGVGYLYIKPITSEKFQLLVRADTNLGNILLNIMVTRDIPFKQQKNNLTFVCVPTPPIPALSKQKDETESAKAVPMLIRVKTEDNATELLQKMDEHRGVTKATNTTQ